MRKPTSRDTAGTSTSVRCSATRRPIIDMGRFSHEAGMVDPRTGYVYETEDSGELQASIATFRISAAGSMQGRQALHARHQGPTEPRPRLFHPIGTKWDVTWVRDRRPDGRRAFLLRPGRRAGAERGSAASKARGGATGPASSSRPTAAASARARSSSTTRATRRSRSFTTRRTRPSSTTRTTSPSRRAAACCSARTRPATTSLEGERLVGLTLDGETFTFAHEQHQPDGRPSRRRQVIAAGDYRQAEWAGACYSPDGTLALREHPDARASPSRLPGPGEPGPL